MSKKGANQPWCRDAIYRVRPTATVRYAGAQNHLKVVTICDGIVTSVTSRFNENVLLFWFLEIRLEISRYSK
jgi:hypothetical protein